MTNTTPPAIADVELREQCARIADGEADRWRKEAAECPAWSAAQGERLRAKDACMNIAAAIRALPIAAATESG